MEEEVSNRHSGCFTCFYHISFLSDAHKFFWEGTKRLFRAADVDNVCLHSRNTGAKGIGRSMNESNVNGWMRRNRQSVTGLRWTEACEQETKTRKMSPVDEMMQTRRWQRIGWLCASDGSAPPASKHQLQQQQVRCELTSLSHNFSLTTSYRTACTSPATPPFADKFRLPAAGTCC